MWSISVEPTPSRIHTPNSSCQRDSSASGSASAAETQNRTDERSRPGADGSLSIAAYSAGTEKKIVGRICSTVSRIASGLGGPARSTVVAPVEGLGDLGMEDGVDDDDPRAAVLDEVAQVVGAVERADRDRRGADPHRAQERRRERRRVVEDEEDAMLRADPDLPQQVPGARHPPRELAV